MTGDRWTIDTARQDGGIVANQMEGDMPEYTRGKTIPFTFVFWHDPTIDDAVGDHISRYRELREYQDYAGSYTPSTSITGEPRFSERLPPSASVESLVVDLVPGPDVQETPGLWIIIDKVDDSTRFVQDTARQQIRGRVLGEHSDYQDRAAVKAALEDSVI